MLQVYTGNGKGKTTAAFGLAMRAAGQGLRVNIVQFCKHGDTGEARSAKKLGIGVHTGEEVDAPPWDAASKQAWRQQAQRQLVVAHELMARSDVLVLDEALGAVHGGFVDEAQLQELVRARPEALELVVTGRNAPAYLLEEADLVSEMQAVKHYYDAGCSARRGIEY